MDDGSGNLKICKEKPLPNDLNNKFNSLFCHANF